MSVSEGSTNNQAPAPSPHVETYTRDSKYYYHDGNTVFLVGGSLFKFQATILAPNESTKPYEFEPLMRDLLDPQNATTSDTKGSSNSNPLTIPNVEAKQFHDLLLAVLGRPGEAEYMSLITDARQTRSHTQDMFLRYSDIGDLAARFGITDLANWAWSQLELLLTSSDRLAKCKWGSATILKLLPHINDMHKNKSSLWAGLPIFILLALSQPTRNPRLSATEPMLDTDVCVQLYRHLALVATPAGRAVFGYSFIFVLSLGHRSSVWVDQLTWQDRAKLYAAQVHMTRLHQIQELNIGWLKEPQLPEKVCATCRLRFGTIWEASFAQCGPLDSAVPLEDVSKLLHLPQYYQQFFQPIRSGAWVCERKCEEAILANIGLAMLNMFANLAEHHKHIVANA
ncbi:hypothetical protein BDV93DRAFT_523617 [Ceratobasidium sp. AG-I]|nr:hypothetical protein BDV93DRAFT_523617 [Ceratobasidium sp. AG-I]